MKRLTFLTLLAFTHLAFISLAQAADTPFGLDDEEEQEVKVERANPDPMGEMLAALVKELPAEEVVNLTLNDEETFLALERAALSFKPKGQVLMLPGDRQHPNWPQGIAPLRQVLPEYGWTTLAISLPIYKSAGVAKRTLGPGPLLGYISKSSEPAKSSEKSDPDTGADVGFLGGDEDEQEEVVVEVVDPVEALNAHRALIEARLQAALQHLGNQGKQVLVLQGESIYWLQPWLKTDKLPKKSPLILLYVEAPAGADSVSFAELIKHLGNRPILDIYAGQNTLQASWAAERKAAYLRAGNKQAVQMAVKVPVSSSDGTDSRWLTQRVEGWLRGLR
ncbi:DUF3530 family protein [Marinospirillum insulare]|uniref:DUF3530 family protein n=1 Tax=Marinospirillum insulare TaxID=217169 RepID=UPI000488806D|nr:DUF3530 family protein [Marinospirillum insulare]